MDISDARAPYADRKPPFLARVIAMRRYVYWEGWGKTAIRAPYGEVSFGSIMIAFEFGNHGRPHLHVAVPGVQVFFHLPRWALLNKLRGGFSWRFGQDWQGDIHWRLGKRSGIRSMPWGWCKQKSDYRREYMAVDGQWHSHGAFPHEWIDAESAGPKPFTVSEPYPYLTRYGEFQGDVTATAYMERTHLIYRVFGVPVKRKTRYSIDVKFNKEVGSKRGSWKGGVVGTSHAMNEGETIDQALFRMRRERDFCR